MAYRYSETLYGLIGIGMQSVVEMVEITSVYFDSVAIVFRAACV